MESVNFTVGGRQNLVGSITDLLPRDVHVFLFGKPGTNGHPQEVDVVDLGWHQMDHAPAVELLEEDLVTLVSSLQPEAD